MRLLHRVTICVLIASLLGLAGCPVGFDRRDGRQGDHRSAPPRHDDSRGDRNDSHHDDNPDQQHDRDHPP